MGVGVARVRVEGVRRVVGAAAGRAKRVRVWMVGRIVRARRAVRVRVSEARIAGIVRVDRVSNSAGEQRIRWERPVANCDSVCLLNRQCTALDCKGRVEP